MADPRVVIVGAGFGGLSCARKLDGKPVQVTLLDQHNYHLFTPLLYQVATGLLNPSDIGYPLRTVFRRSANVRFREARVERVDLERKLVHLAGGDQLPYDFVVLASGSVDNYFGNQAVADASISLKDLPDATRVRNHVLMCLERADATRDADERRALLTFVVVGGGPTGVETSGALAELMDIVAGKDYHQLSRAEIRLVLVEGTDRLLGAFSPRLGRYAKRVLERRGVQVIMGTLVKDADERQVKLSTGSSIETRTVIWSAGVRPNDPTNDASLDRFRNGRIQVDEHLRLPGASGAFAIGDLASPASNGERPLAMLSPPAMQEGRYVAASILEQIRGKQAERQPFRYFDKGTMATIGRNAGITHLPGGLEFTGLLGWFTWLFVHVYYLIGFRNRVSAMLSWAWDYLRHDRPIRIILATSPDRAATTATRGQK
jgi:NADH dehydrogenase